jgi:hypothetical protein
MRRPPHSPFGQTLTRLSVSGRLRPSARTAFSSHLGGFANATRQAGSRWQNGGRGGIRAHIRLFLVKFYPNSGVSPEYSFTTRENSRVSGTDSFTDTFTDSLHGWFGS